MFSRDEQYRQMWNELEKLVKVHSENSFMHKKILDCLRECRKPDPNAKQSVEKESSLSVTDQAWSDFDK